MVEWVKDLLWMLDRGLDLIVVHDILLDCYYRVTNMSYDTVCYCDIHELPECGVM